MTVFTKERGTINLKRFFFISRAAFVALAVCLITSAVACGGTNSSELPAPSEDSSHVSSEIDNSNGYIAEMSAEAGFDMEKASPDDVCAIFGDPDDRSEYKNLGVDCTEMRYSFGTLYFEEREGAQVLTFADITGNLPVGIFGINIGTDMYDAAEKIYWGSSDKIKDAIKNAEVAQELRTLLYGKKQGDDFATPYGIFRVIDIEQSDDSSMYCIECAVQSEVSERMHNISFTFGSNKKLTCIMINCSDIF